MLKTPLTRRKPIGQRTAILKSTPTLREKKCAIRECGKRFQPRNMGHKCCSWECASIFAVAERKRLVNKAAREDRAETRRKLDALKTRSDWIKEAQREFNAYIRARDAHQPCICCGKPFEPAKPGGSMDAGHYLSRGAAPHLRFVESNVHGQRKNCNRPGGTSRAAFRAGMIARIGLAAVEALEADQQSRDYSIDDLKNIKATYKAKTKALKETA